ncbi:MAG TPA: immunoglobulin domain-containing protein, partial [Verrucomicrobiae bacterium]|nr:immunoglobulin domain-containing protein [Verrucomicrobiae bacterium]
IVVAHNDNSGSDMNFQDFEITTNLAVGLPPSIASGSDIPLSVAVASGGGASFGVSASGSPPFSYYWTTNGVPAQNGGRVSGATTATLTIADLTANDNNMYIDVVVSNSAGTYDVGQNWEYATVTVTNPPVGLIYSEGFPFVGPAAGNYPISSVGWTEAVLNSPNALYQVTSETSQGAVFAYYGSPATTVYYATTATDTNQSGLPFPNIDLAAYPSLNFSVDIEPGFAATNVTAYIAVQLNNSSWYASSTPLPVATGSSTFSSYTMAFNPAAANWNNLTVTSSGGLIGSAASSQLKGVMTGAGLVFVTVGSGGTFNFNDFVITGTGVGGIVLGPSSVRGLDLTWVGNPAVELQSSTNLDGNNWQDMTNTYGLYSLTVPPTGPQKYFRLSP